MKRLLFLLPLMLLATACQDQDPTALTDGPQFAKVPKPTLNPGQELGKAIYFDENLSLNENQACASCHLPAWGFTGPGSGVNLRGTVQMGSIEGAFGNRKPPSAAYATTSPVFNVTFPDGDPFPEGGNFWDGRATGQTPLGSPTAEQALGPFLNPAEQALPDKICVLYKIAESDYADLWEVYWGEDIRDLAFPKGLKNACKGKSAVPDYTDIQSEVETNYDRVGLSIAAFENSPEVNAYSSKFDQLGEPTQDKVDAGDYTQEEFDGWVLFNGTAQCSLCHPSEPLAPGGPILFTDHTYDNLGLYPNPLNPAYPAKDFGVGKVVDGDGNVVQDYPTLYGAVKVPTLRNVGKSPGNTVKAFGHNGVFKSLKQIVHFYNTRGDPDNPASGYCEVPLPTTADGLAAVGANGCWPLPEFPATMNTEELGDLGLSDVEEDALVAFMMTLSDGWIGR